MRQAPTDIKLKRSEGVLEVTWPDTPTSRLPTRDLRCACPCAGCVDEHTGVRTLDVASIPADVNVTDMQLVGSYAVQFVFSDGHDTGIFTWDLLATLAERPA